MSSSSSSSKDSQLLLVERDLTQSTPKEWSNAAWYILGQTQSGELCDLAVTHEYVQTTFDNATILVILRTKISRSWTYTGFALGRIIKKNVLIIDVICSKSGGGSSILEYIKEVAVQKRCKMIQLASIAGAIFFYRRNGFELAKPNKRESSIVGTAADLIQQKRYASVSVAWKDPQFLDFLELLRQQKLAIDTKCFTPDECNVDGYHMVHYIPVVAKINKSQKRKSTSQDV